MQRKKHYDYRDYSETLELGQAFEIVKSASKMRKFTMKRMVKFVVLLIFGYIIFSVYLKYRIAHSKADDLQENIGIKHSKDIGTKDTLDSKIKDKIKQVVQDFKRKRDEKADSNVFKADMNEEEIERLIQDKLQGEGEQKVKVEVVDNVKDIDIDDNIADFIKIDQHNVGNAPVDTDEKQSDKNSNGLEMEIEERLAEALKDAANKVEEERHEQEEKHELDKDKADNNKEKAEELEEKLEQEEFQDAAKNVQMKLNPDAVEDLRKKFAKRKAKHDDDHEMPPFVTAVRQSTFDTVLHLLYSIQLMMPGETIHVYDIDLDAEQKKLLMTICDVKVQMFMKDLFPKYFNNLDNLHWKPVVMQTALAEFGHMIWINPGVKLTSHEFAMVVHDSHETGIRLISEDAGYSTYAVTHPGMHRFIPVDKAGMDRLKKDPHLEIKAMVIHNTQEIHENFMKHFTACAMEESCLAPPGAKWQCSFDFTGRRYANCHRYDESAANILLKKMFGFDTGKFTVTKASMFRPVEHGLPPPTNKLKYCKEQKDINDDDL